MTPTHTHKRKAEQTPQRTPQLRDNNTSAAPARKTCRQEEVAVDNPGPGGVAARVREGGRIRKPRDILGFCFTSLANMAVGNQ